MRADQNDLSRTSEVEGSGQQGNGEDHVGPCWLV